MLMNIRALLIPILVHCLFVKNLQLARTINNNPQIARAECSWVRSTLLSLQTYQVYQHIAFSFYKKQCKILTIAFLNFFQEFEPLCFLFFTNVTMVSWFLPNFPNFFIFLAKILPFSRDFGGSHYIRKIRLNPLRF